MSYSKNEVGNNAGVVWRFLDDQGECNIATLKEETNLSRTELLLALGWLLREGKIAKSDTSSRSILFEAI